MKLNMRVTWYLQSVRSSYGTWLAHWLTSQGDFSQQARCFFAMFMISWIFRTSEFESRRGCDWANGDLMIALCEILHTYVRTEDHVNITLSQSEMVVSSFGPVKKSEIWKCFTHPSNYSRPWVASKLYSTMVPFSIAPKKLLGLCFLLILNTSADDSNLTNPPLGQQAAAGFSPSFPDDAFVSTVNQPVLQHEADLPRPSDGLMEITKSLLQADGENVNCAADSPHAHKRLSRSSRRLSKRQQNDFCSLQDHKLAPPSSEPRASDIPAGQQDKARIERLRGSMGGPNEFIPDPMLDYKESQLYGKANSALCPNVDLRVPVCTPYDQKFTSPAPFLVPSRFCMCIFFFHFYIYLSPCPAYDFSWPLSRKRLSLGRQLNLLEFEMWRTYIFSQGNRMTGALTWRETGKTCGAVLSLMFTLRPGGNWALW